jgi:hypothetical protein
VRLLAWLALLSLPATAALALPPAAPPTGGLILAVPGSWLAGFATPVAVGLQGLPLTLANEDIMKHNVVAVELGPPDSPWCFHFPDDQCPLFWSRTVNFGEVAAVEGLAALAPLTAYHYYCEEHPAMEGVLVVVPGA